MSSTAVESPTAGVANYVAAKAAAEAWTMAVADGFRRAAAADGDGQAAAVVLVVKALVDDGLRRSHPERTFPGATDVADLACSRRQALRHPGGRAQRHPDRLAP